MKDQDLDPEFSWPLAFFVTGISFLAFFYFLGKLNESAPRLFLWIGIGSLVVAFISVLVALFIKQETPSSHQEQVDQ